MIVHRPGSCNGAVNMTLLCSLAVDDCWMELAKRRELCLGLQFAVNKPDYSLQRCSDMAGLRAYTSQ